MLILCGILVHYLVLRKLIKLGNFVRPEEWSPWFPFSIHATKPRVMQYSVTWCMSQARINWKTSSRKDIWHKTEGWWKWRHWWPKWVCFQMGHHCGCLCWPHKPETNPETYTWPCVSGEMLVKFWHYGTKSLTMFLNSWDLVSATSCSTGPTSSVKVDQLNNHGRYFWHMVVLDKEPLNVHCVLISMQQILTIKILSILTAEQVQVYNISTTWSTVSCSSVATSRTMLRLVAAATVLELAFSVSTRELISSLPQVHCSPFCHTNTCTKLMATFKANLGQPIISGAKKISDR